MSKKYLIIVSFVEIGAAKEPLSWVLKRISVRTFQIYYPIWLNFSVTAFVIFFNKDRGKAVLFIW
jgi:hypothetical protein